MLRQQATIATTSSELPLNDLMIDLAGECLVSPHSTRRGPTAVLPDRAVLSNHLRGKAWQGVEHVQRRARRERSHLSCLLRHTHTGAPTRTRIAPTGRPHDVTPSCTTLVASDVACPGGRRGPSAPHPPPP